MSIEQAPPSDAQKILLVEDNDVDASVIRNALAKAGGGSFIITRVERLSEALDRLRELDIDLVLLDLMLPDSEGIATFNSVRNRAPDVPIVALTGVSDEGIATDAVKAGAQDFLVKGQVQPMGLARAIRYAIERNRVQLAALRAAKGGKTGRMLGFLGARGGSGTTTVALSIAAAIAQTFKNTIAAELNPYYSNFQDHLFYKFNNPPVENLAGLMTLNKHMITREAIESRLIKLPTGLHVLVGPVKPEEFQDIAAEKVEPFMSGLECAGKHVILDLGCQPTSAVKAAVRRCDFVCVVVERTPVCVNGGKVMIEMLKNCGLLPGGFGAIFVNHMGLSNPVPLPEALTTMQAELVGIVPPAAEVCLQAQRAGRPLQTYDSQNLASVALAEIAQRLLPAKFVPMRL